jgi:light-regulated signal transduction histidine kinase (bacteriophytochrome)
VASHDLQEPLRKVHTFAEGLKTKAVALGKRERD